MSAVHGESVPASCAVAFSNGLDCPHCHARLELAGASRGVSSTAGLLAGWLAWRWTQRRSGGVLDLSLPELYAIIAFGVASALTLMFLADLRLAPLVPVAEPAPAADHGHSGAHH